VKDLTTCGLPFVVVTVTVPLRCDTVVFAWVLNSTVTLPVPLDGVTVTQLGAVTCQDVFDVTALVMVTTPAPGFHAVVATSKVGATPAWVTVKDLVTCGLPFVVFNSMVPVRCDTAVFAAVLNSTVALPVPLDGVTVTQLGAVTCQDVFEVTALVIVTTPAPGFHAVVDTSRVGATPT